MNHFHVVRIHSVVGVGPNMLVFYKGEGKLIFEQMRIHVPTYVRSRINRCLIAGCFGHAGLLFAAIDGLYC